eukprot:1954131-Amphidinium_carterae.1
METLDQRSLCTLAASRVPERPRFAPERTLRFYRFLNLLVNSVGCVVPACGELNMLGEVHDARGTRRL